MPLFTTINPYLAILAIVATICVIIICQQDLLWMSPYHCYVNTISYGCHHGTVMSTIFLMDVTISLLCQQDFL